MSNKCTRNFREYQKFGKKNPFQESIQMQINIEILLDNFSLDASILKKGTKPVICGVS